jgi:hypothetical protein
MHHITSAQAKDYHTSNRWSIPDKMPGIGDIQVPSRSIEILCCSTRKTTSPKVLQCFCPCDLSRTSHLSPQMKADNMLKKMFFSRPKDPPNKTPIQDLENWNIRKYGDRICLPIHGVPMLDEAGNFQVLPRRGPSQG